MTFGLLLFCLVCFTNNKSIPTTLPNTFLKGLTEMTAGNSVGFSVVWSKNKLQKILNEYYLVFDLAARTFANFSSLLAWMFLRVESLDPTGKILHQGYVTLLQTRFVLFNENFMIHRESITNILR